MVVILKDRVHKGMIIPIVDDTAALVQALGFSPIDRLDVRVKLSRARNLLKYQHPDLPILDQEPVLVFEKQNRPSRPARTWAIVDVGAGRSNGISPDVERNGVSPRCTDGDLLPVTRKLLAYAEAHTDQVKCVSAPSSSKARHRRAWAHAECRDLVMKAGLTTGDQIILLVTEASARYFRERLETFGCSVSEPCAGLNQGQRLAWLTRNGF